MIRVYVVRLQLLGGTERIETFSTRSKADAWLRDKLLTGIAFIYPTTLDEEAA